MYLGCCCSVTKSSLMRSHEIQYKRLPYSSLSSRVCSNSRPLCQWCHLTISFSVISFSSCSQFSQHQGHFQSWVFASHGQSIGTSASVLPVNIQDWLPIDWFDLLAFQGTHSSLLQHHNSKHQFLALSFFMVQLSHPYMTTGKGAFVGKVMSLLFNTLSRFVITFLPRSKCLLISSVLSPSTVILEPKKIKSVALSNLPHLFAMKSWDQMPWSSFFECWVFCFLGFF